MSHDPDAVHLPGMPLPPVLPPDGPGEVWVVFQVKPSGTELGGIYTSREPAMAACTEPTDCLMAVPLDVNLGRATELVGEYPAWQVACVPCPDCAPATSQER